MKRILVSFLYATHTNPQLFDFYQECGVDEGDSKEDTNTHPNYQLTYINTYSTVTLTPIHTIYTHRHPHPSYPWVDVGVSPLRHTPHPHIHLPHPTSDPPYTNSVCDTMYLDHRVNCAKVVLHLLSSIILTKGHFLQKAHFERTFYLRTFRSKDMF